MNNQISVGGSYSSEKDNLLKLKRLTTIFTTYTINFGANFPNVPSLQILYTPSVQKDLCSETHLLNVSINSYYSFNTGSLSQSPGISIYHQQRRSSSLSDKSATTQVSLSHSIDFSFPLSLSVNTSFDKSVASASSDNSVTVDLSPSYTLFKSWRNNLSLSGVFETESKRFDVRLNSSYPIPKIADSNFSVTRSHYISNQDDSYDSWCLSASLSKNW